MLLERLLEDMELSLDAFAVCEVASGWRLRLDLVGWVTVHFVLSGDGRLRMADTPALAMPMNSLAVVPAHRRHAIEIGEPVEHEARAVDSSSVEGGLSIHDAGPQQMTELAVACGRIQVRHGTPPVHAGAIQGRELGVAGSALGRQDDRRDRLRLGHGEHVRVGGGNPVTGSGGGDEDRVCEGDRSGGPVVVAGADGRRSLRADQVQRHRPQRPV